MLRNAFFYLQCPRGGDDSLTVTFFVQIIICKYFSGVNDDFKFGNLHIDRKLIYICVKAVLKFSTKTLSEHLPKSLLPWTTFGKCLIVGGKSGGKKTNYKAITSRKSLSYSVRQYFVLKIVICDGYAFNHALNAMFSQYFQYIFSRTSSI